MHQEACYVVSDAHLGSPCDGPDPREEKLVAFCDTVADGAKTLILLGDIFDFWFEYKTVVPADHFRLIAALDRRVRGGTRVLYIAGNHDFWRGDFLTRRVGVELSFEPRVETLYGRKVLFHHGDGLFKNDLSYLIWKNILRNPVSAFLYRWIHPDLGLGFAKWVSRKSRLHNDRAVNLEKVAAEYRAAAPGVMRRWGAQALVTGHTHRADFWQSEGLTYVNTGDWFKNFDYLKIDASGFQLKKF